MKITLTKKDKILVGITILLYVLGLFIGGWGLFPNVLFLFFAFSLFRKTQIKGKFSTFHLIILMVIIGLSLLIKIGFFLDYFQNYSIKEKYEKQLKEDNNLPENSDSIDNEEVIWKTYTNNDYGFSFKYPSQFDVKIEKEISSRNFNDGENVKVTRYDFIFTTGKMVDSSNPNSLDFSGFTISVEPTNGKTIMQVFRRSPAAESLDPTYFVPIKQKGGADEAFIANGIMVYRVKNLFYWSTTFQNSRLLPDGSDDVNQFRSRIFDTIIFK